MQGFCFKMAQRPLLPPDHAQILTDHDVLPGEFDQRIGVLKTYGRKSMLGSTPRPLGALMQVPADNVEEDDQRSQQQAQQSPRSRTATGMFENRCDIRYPRQQQANADKGRDARAAPELDAGCQLGVAQVFKRRRVRRKGENVDADHNNSKWAISEESSMVSQFARCSRATRSNHEAGRCEHQAAAYHEERECAPAVLGEAGAALGHEEP